MWATGPIIWPGIISIHSAYLHPPGKGDRESHIWLRAMAKVDVSLSSALVMKAEAWNEPSLRVLAKSWTSSEVLVMKLGKSSQWVPSKLWSNSFSALFKGRVTRVSIHQGISFLTRENLSLRRGKDCFLPFCSIDSNHHQQVCSWGSAVAVTAVGVLTGCKFKSKAFIWANSKAKVSSLGAGGSSQLGLFLERQHPELTCDA